MVLRLSKGLELSLGSLSGKLRGGLLDTSDGDIEVSCHAIAFVPLVIGDRGGGFLNNKGVLLSLVGGVAASPVSEVCLIYAVTKLL